MISFSAAAGKSIEFRDSVYIDSGSTVKLNADYTYQDAEGASVTVKQQGDIIFTGKYTEQHLNDVLDAAEAGRTATAEEILNSRTTEVNAMTNLYGGRLRVEDGAIYQGCGITTMEGSAATVLVKDATLSHNGYDLTFHAGTTLELAGNNTIGGSVQMLEGSTLLLNTLETLGVADFNGEVNLAGGVTLALSNDSSWTCENGVLMYVGGALSGWDADKLTVTGAGTYGSADVSWVDNLLILNYNANTFNKYYNGPVVYTSRIESQNILKHHYESIAFEGVSSSDDGGAIYGDWYSTITLSDNGSVKFSGNTASRLGGAIYGDSYSTITLSDNGSVKFSGNTATGSIYVTGGAICGDSYSSITLSDNDSVEFIGNKAISDSSSARGGAISGSYYSTSTIITLSDNGSVEFIGNKAISDSSSAWGGAISGGYVYSTSTSTIITLSDNGSVEFIGNTATGSSSAHGGAISGDWYSTITLSDNDSVEFSGNTASSDSSSASGGAIYGDTITLSNNGSVTFSGNTASSDSSSACGGAIYGDVTMTGNGDIAFTGNTAESASSNAYGGAIDGLTITLSDNGSVTFSGNTASSSDSSYAWGGAIHASGNLSIRNNGSVLFEKNVEKSGSSYRLRSIYAGGSGDAISLSAAAGKSIEFRDSVYIASGSTVNLNADYTYLDEAGESVTIRQTGDIIFTGADTEQHLNDLLEAAGAGRTATAQEILNSRTTEVNAMTNLYGGRLCVEDGAIYKGYGITAHEGSDSTIRVKDAELNHAGYDITLNSGTALELEGENKITASNLVMQDGSAFHFVLNEGDLYAMTLTGNLLLNGEVTLSFDAAPGTYRLMNIDGSAIADWSDIVLADTNGYNFELCYDASGISLEVKWDEIEWSESGEEISLSNVKWGKVNVVNDLVYNSMSVLEGTYQISGEGSLGVSEMLSVTDGADVTLDLATMAKEVAVGDDSSLSLQKGLNLVSLMTLDDEETEAAKAISVGRNAELSLTDAALLGQVATADETSAVYYQTETGDKLLKFTGELGNGGLNLTLGEDGRTVRAMDSAGFTGNITVLTGTTLVNDSATATDGLAFGANYATAPDKTITVQEDATLDINGRETYYHLVLEEMSVLKNSGADAHHDWKGIPAIDLQGDAEVIADAQICMVGADYGATSLNLNGHTLYKNGEAALVLRNTAINAGTLAVEQGMVRFMGDTSTAAGTALDVSQNGTLWISEGTGTYAGTLKIGTGGRVYLGEPPQGTMGGDHGTDAFVLDMTGMGEVALAGGTLTFRGEKLSLGSVVVSADSTLEIWDQTGSNGVATTASTISTLNMSANLNLVTTWKSSLDIARLTGSGELLVGSSREKHKVSVQDLSGFTGTFAIRGGNSTLSLNLSGDDEMNAARVTKDDSAVLILEGSGTYCFSNLENVTAAATGISDIQFGDTWSGKIALRNSVATGMELDDFGGAGKTIVIEGVSGWFAYDRTVESHLQLVESGLTLLDTSRKTYTYTGGISGSGDFTIKSKADSTYTGTYDLSGDLSAWDGAFRVQQSGDNTNTAPVNLNLTGGGTLFSGADGCGVLMERTGEMNVTIGHADTASILKGDILNVGVTNEGTTTYGTVNVTLNNTVDAQGDIIASRINVGAGADINFSGTVQADRWSVGKDASLCLRTGAVVYLSEAPNGVLEGDVQTDDHGTLELTEATVELAGGRLSFRGKNMAMGEVNVTSDSVLEIWDQTGVDGVASHACTIDTLNLNASLEQTTTWKCTLEIGSLTGSGPLTVSSRNEKHYVTLNDLSEYTGTVSISGANTTLTLNMVKDAVVNASLVTKDNTSHLVLKGQGSYNIGTARSLAAGVCFAEDWEGSVRLTGAMAGETLSGLNQESSWVELFGVSGYLSQADAAAGAQTYGMNLKLTDAGETAAWNLNNGWNGDVRTFTGMVCGTGTLNRNHYKGTEQTLIFAGDVSGWSGALEHNATSATNNGQKVKTNVKFNGSSEINVAMRTNGKGELNVTIDDEHLSAGSKVNINNVVSASNFTVTEGTAARLNSTLQLSGIAELQAAASLELGSVVTLSAGTETATMETVSVSDSEIRGSAATSAIRNMHLGDMNGDFSIANVGMHAVDISGSNATLTLANVNLDDTCSINLGSGGSISFADSMLSITLAELPVAGTDTLHIDCSALLQSSAYGNLELNFNFTTEEMCNRGYQTLSVEFGAAADYSNLELSLSKAEFKGFVGSIAQFKLVPEPTTTTLSLLALSALAARRRRK